MIQRVSETIRGEFKRRGQDWKRVIPFGVRFLDEALFGILPDDVVLIGAPSGKGKTQLALNIARSAVDNGFRAHFIALEAGREEIERRLKFQIITGKMRADKHPTLTKNFSMGSWRLGLFSAEIAEYEAFAEAEMIAKYKNLSVRYKHGQFTSASLVQEVLQVEDEVDLFIVDHVHYFDFDDNNENRAMKDIAMTARDLALGSGKPFVLISHLRKRDKFNVTLCPDQEEFHGSSDLFKIASRVITMSPGNDTMSGHKETFMRIPKDRLEGAAESYIARLYFDRLRGSYLDEYKLGSSDLTTKTGFEELAREYLPPWYNQPARRLSGKSDPDAPRQPRLVENLRGSTAPVQGSLGGSERNEVGRNSLSLTT